MIGVRVWFRVGVNLDLDVLSNNKKLGLIANCFFGLEREDGNELHLHSSKLHCLFPFLSEYFLSLLFMRQD